MFAQNSTTVWSMIIFTVSSTFDGNIATSLMDLINNAYTKNTWNMINNEPNEPDEPISSKEPREPNQVP